MSTKTVKDAINGYLASVWTDTDVIPVENIYVDQPDDADWLAVQYPGAYISNQAIGNTCWREEGSFTLSLTGVSGQGTADLDTHYENLLPLFMGEDISGVIIRGMTTPTYAFEEARQENESGNAYRYIVTIDYYFDRNN